MSADGTEHFTDVHLSKDGHRFAIADLGTRLFLDIEDESAKVRVWGSVDEWQRLHTEIDACIHLMVKAQANEAMREL